MRRSEEYTNHLNLHASDQRIRYYHTNDFKAELRSKNESSKSPWCEPRER
jgi:hypothetical protein